MIDLSSNLTWIFSSQTTILQHRTVPCLPLSQPKHVARNQLALTPPTPPPFTADALKYDSSFDIPNTTSQRPTQTLALTGKKVGDCFWWSGLCGAVGRELSRSGSTFMSLREGGLEVFRNCLCHFMDQYFELDIASILSYTPHTNRRRMPIPFLLSLPCSQSHHPYRKP